MVTLGTTSLGKMFQAYTKFTTDVIAPYDNNVAMIFDLATDRRGRPLLTLTYDALKGVKDSIDTLEKKIGKYMSNGAYKEIGKFAKAIKDKYLGRLKQFFNKKVEYVKDRSRVSKEMIPGQKEALDDKKETLGEMATNTQKDLKRLPELMYKL